MSPTPGARHAGAEANKARAAERAADFAPIVAELRTDGVTSLRGIAAELNRRDIPTVTGSGRWSHTQVARLLARLTG
jgi:hypothetical protein